MGLLSRATTLDTAKALPGLAFSDFINKHSLKICALLEKENPNYNVTNSIGFDAHSILCASSTADFWNGICPAQGQIYNFTGSDKNQLLQLFSFDLKDNLQEFSVYKSSQDKILLYAGKLTSEAASDFEKVCNDQHKNNIERFNSLIKDGSVVLLYKIEFLDAVKAFFETECKNTVLSFEAFLSASANEIYNRFACRYNISDTTIKNNSYSIKTVIFTDKAYSVELITTHLTTNLKEVFNDFAGQINISYSGIADSCESIKSFLQAE